MTKQPVVPISLQLDEKDTTLVISGANAGGKTVVLKTAGLLSLMALSGLPVPARLARIPLYSAILADIGDHQSIAANLSTFTSHVANVSNMMGECRAPALVLLDEVGTGTDPEEGSALGIAIVDHFRRKLGAHVIASTHYRGLKMYATNQPGVQNASVTFDEKTLRPTYHLVMGQPGASSGVEIASRFGMPEEVTRKANDAVDETSREINRYLAHIKRESEQAEAIRKALEEERQAVAEKYARLDREASQREKKRSRRFEKDLHEAIQTLEEQARVLLQEIRDTALRKRAERRVETQTRKLHREALEKARAATQEQARSLESNAPLEQDVPDPGDELCLVTNRPIRVGDTVRVKSLGKTGRVDRIDKESVELQLGSMRLRQHRSQLELLETPEGDSPARTPARRPQGGQVVVHTQGRAVGTELKLIGKTTEEAVEELDRYLDQAFVEGQQRLRVVHGHGSGALRRAVRNHLQDHPHVVGFQPASREEGGDGATVVELHGA